MSGSLPNDSFLTYETYKAPKVSRESLDESASFVSDASGNGGAVTLGNSPIE